MKKVFIFLILIVVILFGSLYFILYTNSGNSYISKYIENRVNSEQNDFILKIDKFYINKNILTMEALINNISKIDIIADISLFEQSSNINYNAYIDDLSIFNNLISMKLNGKLNTDGTVKIDLKNSFIEGYSNIFGGKLKYIVLNDNLDLNLKDAKLEPILYTLGIDKIFNSILEIDLKYNLKEKNGDMLTKLYNGHFLETEFTKLFSKFSNINITKEIYNDVIINSKIDNKKTISTFFMNSNLSKIDSKDALIDFDKRYIDTNLKVDIKDRKFGISLKDSLDNPTISFDAKELIKNELEKNIGKVLNKFLKIEK